MMMPLVVRLISTTFILAVLVAGCAQSQSGEKALQHLRLQTEERLLQDARVSFFQGTYREAVLLLDRFLTNHPSSRLGDEARWWLARAHQQQGDLHAALRGYRELAQGAYTNAFQGEAQLRVAELESLLGVDQESQDFVGAMVGLSTLVEPNGLERMIQYHRHTGGHAVTVDIPCQPIILGAGGRDDSSQGGEGLWRGILEDVLKPLVKVSKEQKMGVWVGVPLRCLGSYTESSEEQVHRWQDQRYDLKSRELKPSNTFSLFSAEYRDLVFSLLAQLGDLRVDGVLFRATGSPGPFEGLNPLAIRGFEQQFGEPLVPEVLFSSVPTGATVASTQALSTRASLLVDYSPQFWRWAGWKERESHRFRNELAVHLRSQFPFLKIGVELHAESFESPVSALINVSEDWIDTSHGEFDVLVSGTPEYSKIGSRPTHDNSIGVDETVRISHLAEEMVKYMGNPHRAWVILPGEMALSMDDAGKAELPHLPNGVGVLYDFTVVP